MKTCRLVIAASTDDSLSRVAFILLILGLVQISKMILVNGKCIHDTLEPSRGVSPQRYVQNFKAYVRASSNATKNGTSVPLPTSATRSRYTRIEYYYRYRKLRLRTTPSSKRPKRFVEDVSNGTNSNNTISSNNNDTTVQSRNSSRSSSEVYKTKYRNGTKSTSFNSSSSKSTTQTVDLRDMFQPIRITLFFDDEHIDYSNTSAQYQRLNKSLERAITKIEQILSVIPVQGTLLFSRTPEKICSGFWSEPSSPNAPKDKRCGIPNRSYDGEQCLDGFKIPDEHLRGYPIYEDKDDPNPTTILYENGTGLTDTDTVIYIHAEKTTMCKDKGVIAYATYCQLDQNSRPIAGFANFCPDHLADILYDRDTLYLTALHEFFHALGFSKDLFDKFQECMPQRVETENNDNTENEDKRTEMQWVCENRGKTVSFIENRKHIVTPAVTRETKEHLNCSTKQGCPLENHVVLPLRTSSHWEARFMQGSLMSPTIGLPHSTFIDRITLGAFEDMGWYQVDYSQAEDMAWGRNAGCDFSTAHDCQRDASPYFCNRNDLTNGCHFLHLDKGTCETNEYLDRCRAYMSHSGMECWKSNNTSQLVEWKGEVHSLQSRCFIANLISANSEYKSASRRNEFEGRCYLHRCNDSQTLEVQVDGSEWKVCPEGESIEFDEYEGFLRCPSASLLCSYDLGRSQTTPVIGPTNASRSSDPFCATIKITFPKLEEIHAEMKNSEKKPQVAEEAQLKLDMFLMKFTNEIVAVTDIDETRILDIQFINDHTVQFVLMKNIDWSTYTSKDPGTSLSPSDYADSEDPNSDENTPVRYNYVEVSCQEAVRRLLVSVKDGNFKVPLDGQVYKAKQINFTSSIAEMNSLNNIMRPPEKTSQTGTTAAATVGAICGIMLLGVGALLYWKSHVTAAVSPAPPSPTSTDVRYHPNHGSMTTASENGSMGQLTFMA